MGSKNPTVQRHYPPPQALTMADAKKLFDAIGKKYQNPITATRNKAIFVLYWRCGLRCVEALRMSPEDLLLHKNCIYVRFGKGGKPRLVAIDNQAAGYLQDWVRVRAEMNPPPDAPLFFTTRNTEKKFRNLSTSAMREFIKRIQKRARVECRVHIHALRHTAAFDMVRENIPLVYISKQLGHASVAMTERYINHLQPTELIDKMKGRTW